MWFEGLNADYIKWIAHAQSWYARCVNPPCNISTETWIFVAQAGIAMSEIIY